MSAVLAIDTSSRRRVVCVLAGSGGEVLQRQIREDVSVGSALPAALHALPAEPVAALVVVTGPGSYTGVRAGMAAALGFAQARNLPLHGVGSLEVIAAGWLRDDATAGLVVADAGRGAVYAADCVRRDGRWHAGPPRRVPWSAMGGVSVPIASADLLSLASVDAVNPASALARAVPGALHAPPLRREAMRAQYAEESGGVNPPV